LPIITSNDRIVDVDDRTVLDLTVFMVSA